MGNFQCNAWLLGEVCIVKDKLKYWRRNCVVGENYIRENQIDFQPVLAWIPNGRRFWDQAGIYGNHFTVQIGFECHQFNLNATTPPLHIRAFYSTPKMGGWVGASVAKGMVGTLENSRKVSPYELSVWFWILSRSCSFSTMLKTIPTTLLCMHEPRKKVLLPYYCQYCNASFRPWQLSAVATWWQCLAQ